MKRLSEKPVAAFLFCLLCALAPLPAYENLALPIDQNMSRADVERVLGRPGFLIYTNMMIQGISQKLEVSMAGYRVPEKNGQAKLITIIFFQDNIQLSVSAFYEKKAKDKLMAKILKNAQQMRVVDVRSLRGYLDNRTLDFYLSDKGDGSPGFPPQDLQDYFQSEDFFNFAVAHGLLKAIAELTATKHIPDLYSITYMNLRLVASVASQGLMTPKWRN